MTDLTKTCSQCGETKPVAEFNRQTKHGRNPYQRYCKVCQSAAYKAWAAANHEKKLADIQRWYRANIPAVRAYDAARWALPATKERYRQNVAANRERYNSYGHAHRARKFAAP